MKIAATKLCRCRHKAAAHTYGVFKECTDEEFSTLEIVQTRRARNTHSGCSCEKFELDNLDLIEYLAEQRGLI